MVPSARTRSATGQAQVARDERLGGAPEQVVGVVAVAAAQLEDVAEALR